MVKPQRLSDDASCYLCDYWWLLLVLLLLLSALFFTRDSWERYVFPPAPTFFPTTMPTRASTPTDIITPTLMRTANLTPTRPPAPTEGTVKTPGTGDVQVMMTWIGLNDLDLIVIDPAGYQIYYQKPASPSGGVLDIDSNAGCSQNIRRDPVENIFWPTGQAPRGEYRVYVQLYKVCEAPAETPFSIRLLVDGKELTFTGSVNANVNKIQVTKFVR